MERLLRPKDSEAAASDLAREIRPWGWGGELGERLGGGAGAGQAARPHAARGGTKRVAGQRVVVDNPQIALAADDRGDKAREARRRRRRGRRGGRGRHRRDDTGGDRLLPTRRAREDRVQQRGGLRLRSRGSSGGSSGGS